MNEKNKWILDNGIFYPISEVATLHETPGNGIWELIKDPDPRFNRLGLQKLSNEFKFDFKLYKTGGDEIIKKIKFLWEHKTFKKTNKNLGVIFNGTKGSGKTICAKKVCNEIGLPVIIVNQSYEGAILDFISSLSFEAIILIDEAEKTFVSEEDSHILLKLIDGVYNNSRKIYLLTTNRLILNDNLLGRPGRIRYIQEFGNLPKETVDEFLEENLNDKSKRDLVIKTLDSLSISTIDILKTIIEEVNIFGTIESNLSIPKNTYTYDIVVFENYNPEDDLETILEIIKANKPENISLYEWFKRDGKEDDEGEEIKIMSLFENNDKYCYISTLSTSTELCAGCMTSRGEVISEITTTKGGLKFMLIKPEYGNQEVYPIIVLKKRKNISLYNNKYTYLV